MCLWPCDEQTRTQTGYSRQLRSHDDHGNDLSMEVQSELKHEEPNGLSLTQSVVATLHFPMLMPNVEGIDKLKKNPIIRQKIKRT